MKRTSIIICILPFIISCSISGEIIKTHQYTKESWDYDQYQKDRYQCEHESYLYAAPTAQGGGIIPTMIAVDRRVSRFEQCMRVKGYQRMSGKSE